MEISENSSSQIKFGTSGLRGPADGFTPKNITAYLFAFLSKIDDSGARRVYIGADLRQSSPFISACCISAVKDYGWEPVFVGNVPTPALADFALANNCPAIMVTGSHIPDTYNGIKFYRRDGELLKEDEEPIALEAARLLETKIEMNEHETPVVAPEIARSYVRRYTDNFAKNSLKGLKLGVDLHSAVGRDLLVEILEALGADCYPFRRSDKFIAVDTEALSEEDILRAKTQLKENNLDAIVSTDGDGDRPLLIDENGRQVNGDVLGALCAKLLGIDIVVTPLSSTSAIEQSGWFEKVIRTKIGSPYVVAAMAEQEKNNDKKIAGFEANGGFLTQSEIALANGNISGLPTRDAILPLISVLSAVKLDKISVSKLVKTLPSRFMVADRIKGVKKEIANVFMDRIANSNTARKDFDIRLDGPTKIDLTDGVRLSFANSNIVHFRQSGNAPEMRIYVETNDSELSRNILSELIIRLEKHLTLIK